MEAAACKAPADKKTTVDTDQNKGQPKPLVARISIWTTKPNGKLTRLGASLPGSGDSDDNHDYDDDGNQRDGNNAGDDDDEDLEMDENGQLELRLRQAKLPEHVRRVAQLEMQKLRRTPSFMSDHSVTRSYLELLAELPWFAQSPEHIDLRKCRRDLDLDHYGMEQAKERILQYLAVRKLKAASQTRVAQPILLLVGPPGTGKTSIAQSIAKSLGRRFQRISLGGVSDQSAIRGHRRTYIAAMPGRIIQGIKQAGVNNPVFLLDEVDKMSAGPQGDPAGALLEVLDPEQNHTFTDHYLNLAFDLSSVLFVATANSTQSIPAALLDRMELVQVSGYTHDEKMNIARRHLVPKQVVENGLWRNMIVFKDCALSRIITSYAQEAGVRSLERRLATVCRTVAVEVVENSVDQQGAQWNQLATSKNQLKLPVVVEAGSLEQYLGPPQYERDSRTRSNVPGVAIGLAWTAVGGEITFVEAELLRGPSTAPGSQAVSKQRERLVLTGQLGSVMRESALLAMNWLRANHHLYRNLPQSLERDLLDNTVHIHFPAGAVGKDGPSAGVTIVVALLSLLSGLAPTPDLAMTGEITLRGLVLKVGGVKAKLLAAHRAGLRQVILPSRNQADLAELPAPVKDKMRFHFVSTLDEVIAIAFDNRLSPAPGINPTSTYPAPGAGLTSKL